MGAGIPSHTHQPDWIGQCDGDDHHHHHHFVPREVANNEICGAKKVQPCGRVDAHLQHGGAGAIPAQT